MIIYAKLWQTMKEKTFHNTSLSKITVSAQGNLTACAKTKA